MTQCRKGETYACSASQRSDRQLFAGGSGCPRRPGGTAANTQYRADITLPAGKAVDYRMDITFIEADQFYLVDLQSQLAASGRPYHVQASVTAPPPRRADGSATG